MKPIVTAEISNIRGTEEIRLGNELGKIFTEIAGSSLFSRRAIEAIKSLGYDVVCTTVCTLDEKGYHIDASQKFRI